MKTRKFRTDIWGEYFFQELEIDEKLLFIFLVTNPHCQLIPVYQCTNRTMRSYLPEISEQRLLEIEKKFEDNKRFYFKEGFVFLTEYTNWELNINAKLIVAYKKQFNELPKSVQEYAKQYCNDSVWIDYRKTTDICNDSDNDNNKRLVKTKKTTKTKRSVENPKTIIVKRYRRLTDLTQSDFEEIAIKYQTTSNFVQRIYDDLTLYCGSKGVKYADYRLTLMAWVRRKMEEKGQITPSGLKPLSAIQEKDIIAEPTRVIYYKQRGYDVTKFTRK